MKQPNVKKLVKSPESFCCCWQEKKQFLFFDKGPSNITKNWLWRGNIALKWWEHRNTRKQQTNTSLTHLTQTHALRAIKPGGQMSFLTMQTINCNKLRKQGNKKNPVLTALSNRLTGSQTWVGHQLGFAKRERSRGRTCWPVPRTWLSTIIIKTSRALIILEECLSSSFFFSVCKEIIHWLPLQPAKCYEVKSWKTAQNSHYVAM